MDQRALLKRMARSFGLAMMIAGGLLTGVATTEAIEVCPHPVECDSATLSAAYYAAMFALGGALFFWSRRA